MSGNIGAGDTRPAYTRFIRRFAWPIIIGWLLLTVTLNVLVPQIESVAREQGPALSLQVVEEVKKFFRNKVYQTIIPRSVRLGEAPSFGLPINLYAPKSVGAQAYQNLAVELLGKE